jgi:hypothetical protein
MHCYNGSDMTMGIAEGNWYPAAMKRFDLRLPDELHARLSALADREHRSIHGQIIKLIEDGVDRADRERENPRN